MKTDLFQIALSHDIYHTLYLCSLLSSTGQDSVTRQPSISSEDSAGEENSKDGAKPGTPHSPISV